MLDKFKRFLTTEKSDKEVVMKKEDKQALIPAVDINMAAELKQAQASLLSHAADMQAMQELMSEMSEKLENATAALKATEDTKAALLADIKVKQAMARKESIITAVGTEKAGALMAATESLDDVQFGAIISAMAASFENESKSAMFSEQGMAAETKVGIDPVDKLAAALAAKFETK